MLDVELDTDSDDPVVAPVAPVAPVSPQILPSPSVEQQSPTPAVSTSSSSSSSSDSNAPSPSPAPRRSARERRPPGEWWKVHRESTSIIESSDEAPDSETEVKQEEDEDGDIPGTFFTDPAHTFAAALSLEPSTYVQAMAHSDATQWTQAAKEELDAHCQNGTWELSDLPPGQKAIGCRWVFKVKHKADGSVERYKA